MTGPFAEVEALLGAGRIPEALSALARSSGGAAWEALLWRGRIEERRGRLADAERAFREAARVSPKAAPELARLLEDEAYAGERRARLAAGLRSKAGREALARELSAALAAQAPVSGARIEALLQLIDAGGYAPEPEKALLAAVSRAEDGSKLAGEWPQVFSALMCARRYHEAFRLGEAVLDRFGRIASPGQLMWPWWRRMRRAVAEDAFIASELGRIREAARAGRFRPWFAYYRAILTSDGSRHQGRAMLEYRRIKALDGARYAWMLESFVLVKLGVLDYAGAVAVSRDILRRAPSHWWVRCRMAEAFLAAGDTARGLREFREAERTAAPGALGEILTWHGEALLWLGRYDRSLAKLDAAVALGAKTFVYGWRGAARLKSGDLPGALADLDRAVALDPKDFEARGWRAEALRVAGRGEEALADLEHLVARGPRNYWTHANRALLRGALGDERGMAADLAEVPAETLSWLKKKLAIPRDRTRLSPGEMRLVLESLLARSKGVRRWERYVQPIWMERSP